MDGGNEDPRVDVVESNFVVKTTRNMALGCYRGVLQRGVTEGRNRGVLQRGVTGGC